MIPWGPQNSSTNFKRKFTTTLAPPAPGYPMPVSHVLGHAGWLSKSGTTEHCATQLHSLDHITSATEASVLENKQTHNSSESKDFCMLPEYRTRDSSFYCLGNLLPSHFPECRISSFYYGRRKMRPHKDFPFCLLSF